MEINPKLTAWVSFLFSFLDGVTFQALVDGFPPLADYDCTARLVKKSYPVRLHTLHIYCVRS